MTRHVHPSAMVMHLWAHQSQDNARNGKGSVHFSGHTLYSYSTPIAQLVPVSVHDGTAMVALISNKSYSVTTSGHQSGAGSAARHLLTFRVPFIGAPSGRNRHDSSDLATVHIGNLESFATEYKEECAKAYRARHLYQSVSEYLRLVEEKRDNYCAAFGLTGEAFNWADDAAEIERRRAERDAKNNTPEAIAKRERAEQRKIAKMREDFRAGHDRPGGRMPDWATAEDIEARRVAIAAIDADKVSAWRQGLIDSYSLSWEQRNLTMLRVRGNDIETSLGARFPVADARAAFYVVARVRKAGATFERGDRGLSADERLIRLGSFAIDRIGPSGDVKAGCHNVSWVEIERCARELGLIPAVSQ